MEENKKNIIERNTHEIEGKHVFKIADAFLELEARYKNIHSILDEIKEVLQGQAAWSKATDERLQRIDPKIILPGDEDFNNTIKGL